MIIYLDESKKLAEGKIVLGGFITKHNNHYINKYIESKKIEYGFGDINMELKGIKDSGKLFYDNILDDEDFSIIANNIVGVSISGYYKDNLIQYIDILSILITKIYTGIKSHKSNITIISDFLIFGKDTNKIEKQIISELNTRFPLYKGYKFKFVNSKNYGGVQLADLISYQLRLANINNEKEIDELLEDNNFNIDLTDIIKI